MGYGKVEGTFQVLHQRLSLGGIVVEINLLIENGEISGLFEVGGTSGDQQSGSSLKPLPISMFPFFVSGWY